MTKISANTWFIRKAFPAIWFGFLAVLAVTGAAFGEPLLVVIPVVLALFGFLLLRMFVWDLVDEVFDDGDALVVRHRGDEQRIPLANIMNVSVTSHVNPPRITLRLVTPGRFGSEVVFSPVKKFTLNPFAKNEVAEDLIVRVHEARTGGMGAARG
jgi:hypothetical protein